MSPTAVSPPRRRVPVRTILATIGLVLATALAVLLIVELRHILVWIVVAAFFTVALYPVVNWVQHRVGDHRVLATLIVFALFVIIFLGLLTLFVVPLAQEAATYGQQLPQLIKDIKAGRGPIGHLLARTKALDWVQSHSSRLGQYAAGLTSPAAGVLRGIATGVAGILTIFVLAILMVLEGPKIVDGTLGL